MQTKKPARKRRFFYATPMRRRPAGMRTRGEEKRGGELLNFFAY
jgi:hypothetical protein